MIKSTKVVVKKGEAISADLAAALDKLQIHPIEVGLDVKAVFEKGFLYKTDVLAIDDPTVLRALRYIHTHAHHGIVVDDILREVPISRRSLEIQFRAYLGRSPAEEIRRVRLDRGRQLLGVAPRLALARSTEHQHRAPAPSTSAPHELPLCSMVR